MNDITPTNPKQKFAIVGNPVIHELIDDDKTLLLSTDDDNQFYDDDDLLAVGTLIGKMMNEITSQLSELNIPHFYKVSKNLSNLNKFSIAVQKEANAIIKNTNYKYNDENGYYVQLRPYVFCNYNEEQDKYTFGVNDKITHAEQYWLDNGNIDEIKNMIYDYNKSPSRPKDCTNYIVVSYEFIKRKDLLIKALDNLIDALQD